MEKMNLIALFLVVTVLAANAQRNDKCLRKSDEQIIWEYDVRRSYRIDAYQEVDAEYGPANVTITCIGVDPTSDVNSAAMWVTAGGHGYNFVKIKFRSKYSRGIRYRIYVYGKPH